MNITQKNLEATLSTSAPCDIIIAIPEGRTTEIEIDSELLSYIESLPVPVNLSDVVYGSAAKFESATYTQIFLEKCKYMGNTVSFVCIPQMDNKLVSIINSPREKLEEALRTLLSIKTPAPEQFIVAFPEGSLRYADPSISDYIASSLFPIEVSDVVYACKTKLTDALYIQKFLEKCAIAGANVSFACI